MDMLSKSGLMIAGVLSSSCIHGERALNNDLRPRLDIAGIQRRIDSNPHFQLTPAEDGTLAIPYLARLLGGRTNYTVTFSYSSTPSNPNGLSSDVPSVPLEFNPLHSTAQSYDEWLRGVALAWQSAPELKGITAFVSETTVNVPVPQADSSSEFHRPCINIIFDNGNR